MNTKRITVMLILAGLSVVLVMLALSTLPGMAQDEGYPAPIEIGYPDPYWGYPIENEILGYPVVEGVPDGFYITIDPAIPDSSIELVSNPLQLDPITPQYRNGRNLWQEIVYQFSRLLELIK